MSWTITIHGFGSHCNRGNPPADADSIAATCVQALRAAGHRVDSATFTHGHVENLADRPEPGADGSSLSNISSPATVSTAADAVAAPAVVKPATPPVK